MLWLTLACSGADTPAPTDTAADTGRPTTGDTAVEWEVVDPTWSGMERFFELYCDACHPSMQSLDLHAAIPADLASGAGTFVVAGDPDGSKLWQVLIGAGYSASMPYDADLLPSEVVEPVRQWIEAGAAVP